MNVTTIEECINWFVLNPVWLIAILLVVLLIKGSALYRAARKGSKVWFWVILCLNTLGIVPLLYLIFSKGEGKSESD